MLSGICRQVRGTALITRANLYSNCLRPRTALLCTLLASQPLVAPRRATHSLWLALALEGLGGRCSHGTGSWPSEQEQRTFLTIRRPGAVRQTPQGSELGMASWESMLFSRSGPPPIPPTTPVEDGSVGQWRLTQRRAGGRFTRGVAVCHHLSLHSVMEVLFAGDERAKKAIMSQAKALRRVGDENMRATAM